VGYFRAEEKERQWGEVLRTNSARGATHALIGIGVLEGEKRKFSNTGEDGER